MGVCVGVHEAMAFVRVGFTTPHEKTLTVDDPTMIHAIS